MKTKRVTRYYADCGRGYWKKVHAINHEKTCICWTNPKMRCCKSCKYHKTQYDNNDHDAGYPGEGFIDECLAGVEYDSPDWTYANEKAKTLNINCPKWETR